MIIAGPIGIFGGTFDPIHYGHLRLAEELADRLGLAEVRLIPARIPPHRASPSVDVHHRLEMVRLAIAGNAHLALDDRECRREGPSYTVDTLLELRHELPASRPLFLLLGVDAFLALTTWSRWERLFELTHLVIAHRPGYRLDTDRLPAALARHYRERLINTHGIAEGGAGKLFNHAITALDISATDIRAAIQGGQSARYLLPDAVLDYIQQHQLYKDIDGGRGHQAHRG